MLLVTGVHVSQISVKEWITVNRQKLLPSLVKLDLAENKDIRVRGYFECDSDINFPTGPNDALEQHWHPLLTPGDTFTKLNGGCFFCQINLFEAHLQLEMDGKSWSLLTINTRRELYRYNRLQEWATTLLNYDSTVE
ncbi:unnamed protein product [Toxocara canis]|uniref:DUF5869 domain-containing protein n=1 Tax=Toxocara canis TaxID=6265 RepID=A0A183UFV3_TOXCA|nr:unnamed protein product [Toxocara canis]